MSNQAKNQSDDELERLALEAAKREHLLILDTDEYDRQIDAEIERLETVPIKLSPADAIFDRVLSAERASEQSGTSTAKPKKANHHFKRAVLAAEIVGQLHEEPTFGRIKFQKMMYLCEQHVELLELQGQYKRDAAGPHDNAMMRSVTSQMEKQKWFKAIRRDNGTGERFVALEKAGGHQMYFDKYWGDKKTDLQQFLTLFKSFDTTRCEIVATLFAAWNDLIIEKSEVGDDLIVAQVLNNWHENKQAIAEDRWRKALNWMRTKGIVPKGLGAHTTLRKSSGPEH